MTRERTLAELLERYGVKSLEGCSIGDDGVVSDAAFHAEILSTPGADEAIAEMAIAAAIERGVSEADARLVYGVRRPGDGG